MIIDNKKWLFEDKKQSSYATVKVLKDATYIVCRETTGKKDWKTNFQFWKKPYKRMNKIFFVHSGFMKDYSAIKESILKWMDEKYNKENKLIIVGYSQGGAIAQLIYEELIFKGYKVEECVTFASPKVFTFINRKELNRRMPNIRRIENGQDIVTRLPWNFLGYFHLGKTIRTGKKRLWFLPFGLFGKHHQKESYLESLK